MTDCPECLKVSINYIVNSIPRSFGCWHSKPYHNLYYCNSLLKKNLK